MATNVFVDTNRSYTSSVGSKQQQIGRAGSQTAFSNRLEQSRQELLSSHEQFMKKHLDAATKLTGARRTGPGLGERRPSTQLRSRKDATNDSRMRKNFAKIIKEYGGGETPMLQGPASEMVADHNALKQFAMDQLSILSAKTSQKGNRAATAGSNRTSMSERRRRGGGWDAHRKAMAAFGQKPAAGDNEYQRNVDFLKDKEDRESAVTSGKVPQKARRLINLKAALFEENPTSANSEPVGAGMQKDDDSVAPRGGKVTLEAKKDALAADMKKEEAFDEKRFRKFTMATRAAEKSSKIDRPYHKDLEKTNLCRRIRDRLRFEFQQMYRCAENAYAALDKAGLGFVTKEAFMDSVVVKHRVPFTKEQLDLYFVENNLYARGSKGIDFDSFKKNFFPQHYLVQDPPDDFEDKQAQITRDAINTTTEAGQQDIVNARVRELESKLKLKFSNYFTEVQKAFLLLDQDYDGYITVEDMIKYFGNDNTLNYTDLKKLMTDKDSSKQGRLNYSDFSKWLGGAIHLQQGFFFRHDSRKNPALELFFEKDKANQKHDDREEAARILCDMPTDELRGRILRKIAAQWKTLRACFTDINRARNGLISPDEFRGFMNHWKFVMTDDVFQEIFNYFDHDKDGFINYKDCAKTIGPLMYAKSNQYFRMDNKQNAKINCCKMDQCWQPTKNTQNYCELHQKMQSDIAIGNFSLIFEHVGEQWPKFIKKIKKVANPEDQSQLFVRDFKKIVREFGGKLSSDQFEQIRLAFPGKERPDVEVTGNDDDTQTVNVVRLYDQKYSQIMEKIYSRVNVAEGGADEAEDFFGYLGRPKNYRRKFKALPIAYDDFYNIICAEPKLKEMILAINSTQLNNKGEFIKGNYVTKAEMEDIIKELYPKLNDYELDPILSLYSLPQLKIIIDYRSLRDAILAEIAKRNGKGKERDKSKEKVKEKEKTKPSSTQTKLQAKIDLLENQIQRHKQNSQELSKQLENKFGVNRKNLERLNQSADETSNAYQVSKYGYQKLSQQKLDRFNQSRATEAGNSVSKQRPRTTHQIRSNAPSFSQRQLVNDYKDVSKRVGKKVRPMSQASGRSGSVGSRNSKNSNTGGMNRTKEEFVNIKTLISGDRADPRLKTLSGKPSPRREYMSPLKKGSLERMPDDGDTIRYGSLNRRTVDDKPVTSSRKASVEQRLNDYTDKMIEARRQHESKALLDKLDQDPEDAYYANSKLCATDESVMRKIMSYAATRNNLVNTRTDPMDRAGTEMSGEGRASSPMVDFGPNGKMHSSLIDPNFVSMAKGQARDDLIACEDQSDRSLSQTRPRAARPKTGHISPFIRTPKGLTVSLERRAQSNLRAGDRAIQSKLAYEWKNIYRSLMQMACDRETENKKGDVTISEFNKACLRYQVNFTREELSNVRKIFGYGSQHGDDFVDFERLSHQYGLHKGSFDYFQRSFANNRSKSMYRLKQLYLSIEPVKEEIEEGAESRDKTSRLQTKRNSNNVSAVKQRKLAHRRTSTPTGHVSNNLQSTVNQLAKTVTRQKLRRQIDTSAMKKAVEEKPVPPQFSTAAEIKIALDSNLARFEKLCLLHLRKKEIDSQIARNLGNEEDMVILPVTAFKQVLGQLGLRVSDNMLRKFQVKGDFKVGRDKDGLSATQSQFDRKSNRSLSMISKDLQNRTVKGAANQVLATVRQGGRTTLGIDVEGFVEHFTGQ